MKLKFKVQPYQTLAVESVVECFAGQTNTSGMAYRIDPGRMGLQLEVTGFKNTELQLTDAQLLDGTDQKQRVDLYSCRPCKPLTPAPLPQGARGKIMNKIMKYLST